MDAKLTRCSPAGIVLGVALAAGCLLWSGCKPGADVQQKPVAGVGCATSPAAKSPKELALAGFLSGLKLEGKPVLIEFGMVGCVLSGQGLDNMIALQTAGTVPGLAFVRVEGNPDDAAVAQYFKDKAPPFPVYRDSQSALAKALSATAYPTFLLADKFGHIRYQGNYPQENLVKWAQALVAENQDPGGNAPQFGARELERREAPGGQTARPEGPDQAPGRVQGKRRAGAAVRGYHLSFLGGRVAGDADRLEDARRAER